VRGVQDALQSLGSGNVKAAMNQVQQTLPLAQ
jgi:hypothetical protein